MSELEHTQNNEPPPMQEHPGTISNPKPVIPAPVQPFDTASQVHDPHYNPTVIKDPDTGEIIQEEDDFVYDERFDDPGYDPGAYWSPVPMGDGSIQLHPGPENPYFQNAVQETVNPDDPNGDGSRPEDPQFSPFDPSNPNNPNNPNNLDSYDNHPQTRPPKRRGKQDKGWFDIGPRKNSDLIEYRRLVTAQCLARKFTRYEILQEWTKLGIFNPNTQKPYSMTIVVMDIAVIKDRWRRAANESYDRLVGQLWGELEEIKREGWSQMEMPVVLNAIKQQRDLLGLDKSNPRAKQYADALPPIQNNNQVNIALQNVSTDTNNLPAAERTSTILKILGESGVLGNLPLGDQERVAELQSANINDPDSEINKPSSEIMPQRSPLSVANGKRQ